MLCMDSPGRIDFSSVEKLIIPGESIYNNLFYIICDKYVIKPNYNNNVNDLLAFSSLSFPSTASTTWWP